jgi:hypothetical protein
LDISAAGLPVGRVWGGWSRGSGCGEGGGSCLVIGGIGGCWMYGMGVMLLTGSGCCRSSCIRGVMRFSAGRGCSLARRFSMSGPEMG